MLTAEDRDSGIPSYDSHEFSRESNDYAFMVITLNEGERLKKQLDSMQSHKDTVDIIVVDGHSTDGSTDHEYLKSKDVNTLINCNEKGLGTTLRAAFDFALSRNYKGIITIDGNGKDQVDAVTNIISKLGQGYDFIQASRFMKGGVHKNTPLLRFWGIHLVILPTFFLGGGYWYTDPTNGFKGLSRKFLLNKKIQPLRAIFQRFNMQYYLNYSAAKHRFKVDEVPASRVYPDDGSVPTKIHGFSSHFKIFAELFVTCIGGYDPKDY